MFELTSQVLRRAEHTQKFCTLKSSRKINCCERANATSRNKKWSENVFVFRKKHHLTNSFKDDYDNHIETLNRYV